MKNQNIKFKYLKTIFVVILLLFTTIDSYSQYQIRHYDMFCTSTGQDYGRAIINRIDPGYAIAGYSYQFPACIGSYEWMFIKLKPDGLIDCVRLLGITKDDKCYSLTQSNLDLGYVLAGYTSNTFSPFKKKATMTKLNAACNLMYSRAIADTNNHNYYQVVRGPGDTLAFTGYIQHVVTLGILKNKILAAQYSPFGALNWAYKYVSPGSSTEEAFSICSQPVSGTYGVAVRTNFYSGSSSVFDLMLVKLSASGIIIWKKVYKFDVATLTFYPNTEPRKIIPMSDGGFVVVGFTNVLGQTQRDIIVLRVSASGAVVWSKTYGSSGLYEQGESITLDGSHLVLTGSERTVSPVGSPDALIMKIPATGGAPIWTKTWDADNPTDIGYDIVKSTVGAPDGYAITGHTSRPAVLNDPFLWRVNINGIVPVDTCNDPINTPYVNNIHRLDSFPLNRFQLSDITRQCIEVTPTPLVTTLCLSTDNVPENSNEGEDVKEHSLKQNSPNPFNPVTTIHYELPLSGFANIKVYDISGRLVSTLLNEFKDPGRYEVKFDGSNLASGVYYYKIEIESLEGFERFTDIKKMILIK